MLLQRFHQHAIRDGQCAYNMFAVCFPVRVCCFANEQVSHQLPLPRHGVMRMGYFYIPRHGTRDTMGALRIHFKHFQLRILSLYKQSRYFLQHNHDALRLFISLRFHDFFLRQYFTSVA